MRKLLTILLLLTTAVAHAQNGSKPDFIRTPNSNFTIVDYNFKAKTFNLPHYSSITRRPSQDSIGTIFLSTVDQHIYIKKQVGSVYYPLAFLSDIPSPFTFTNDFTKSGTLVGFADTLHRTNLPYTINNTSTSNPALVVNGNSTTNIQVWSESGVAKASVALDGGLRSPYIANQVNSSRSTISLTDFGTIIARNINDNNPTLKVVQANNSATGQSITNVSSGRINFSIGNRGGITSKGTVTSTTGLGTGMFVNDAIIPSANGDLLIGSDFKTIFGTSTISSINTSTFTGGSGYTVSDGSYNVPLTGGTGSYASANITIASGIVTAVSLIGGGVNYTNGDTLGIMLTDASGNPVGSGFSTTVTGVSSFTGTQNISARFQSAPIVLSSVTTPASPVNGMLWQDGTHLYTYIAGTQRQLDQQIGVTSIFGRNGNVVAQSGDYNTSQVTESGNLYFTNARVLTAPLTGYVSGAGVISSSDNILQAIQKLNGNIAASVTGVSSFNTRTGAITLTTADVNAVGVTTLGTVTAGAVPYTLLSGTVPTWNQNTTGSAATLTTSRTINGTSFNGSANITITANTPNSLANGYGILGGSFNGSGAVTLRVDTARGKLVTTYGLLDTINAHGASAGYGINSAQFALGNVVVDTVNVASKSWGMAAFYTKNQILTNNFIFTSFHAHKDSTSSASNIPLFSMSNNFISTASTDLFSPSLRWRTHLFNGGIDKTLDFNMRAEGNSSSTVGQFLLSDSLAGGTRLNLLSVDRFGNFNVLPTASRTTFTLSNGDLSLNTPGNKIKIATGINATLNTVTLSSGTVTVSNNAVTASSIIIVTYGPVQSGTLGFLTYGSVTAGSSFIITSKLSTGATNTADNSQVNYWILN